MGTTLLEYYERALQAVEDPRYAAQKPSLLDNIGGVHRDRGDLDQALTYFEQALRIRQEIGDRRGEAVTQFDIGISHRKRGDLAAAVISLERAVAPDELVGHPDLESDRKLLEEVRSELEARN